LSFENTTLTGTDGKKAIIMHRDIKPANILFHNGELKIADFGFAKIVDEAEKDTKSLHTILGTPLYMNPQSLNNEAYGPSCDVWSAGIVVYECLFEEVPWNGKTRAKLLENIKNFPVSFPKEISEEAKDLLRNMLKVNEKERLTWK